MPLKPTKRSVLFHKGLSDGTDRFLVEPPSIDYAENLTLGKDGSFAKRYGAEAITQATGTGTPLNLYEIDGNLHTLAPDGAYSFINGQWAHSEVGGFIGTKTVALESHPQSGCAHIDSYQSTDSDTGKRYWTIVFEVREHSTITDASGTPIAVPKHVVIQAYDEEGNFIVQRRIDDARSPKVVAPAAISSRENGYAFVFYQSEADNKIKGRTFVPNPHAQIADPLGGEFDSGIAVSEFATTEVHSRVNQSGYITRLGASSDGHARYQVATNTDNDYFYILYSDKNVIGTVKSAHLSPTLFASTSVTHWTSTGYGPDGEMAEPLAVDTIGGVDVALYFRFATTTDLYDGGVYLAYYTGQTEEWVRQVSDTNDEVVDHGTLKIGLGIFWAAHISGVTSYTDVPLGISYDMRDPKTGIDYGLRGFDGALLAVSELPHHRIASSPAWLGGRVYMAVQQWADYTPIPKSVEGFENWATLFAAIKPVSTVLCSFDPFNDEVDPVACVDARSSKFAECTEAEFVKHIPALHVIDGDIYLLNRVAINAEDASMWMGEWGAFRMRFGSGEHPAEAQARLHRISPSPSEFMSAWMGDSIVTATAVPLWFDGRFFGEFGVLDAPEIIRVEDDRNNQKGEKLPQGNGPDDNGVGLVSDRWRKMAIVVGYYDQKGNKHRSPPSTTLYVSGLTPQYADTTDDGFFPILWQGKNVTVYFTWPISMLPNDLEYFVELYASSGLDDDMVLVDTNTIKRGTVPTFRLPARISTNATFLRYVGGTYEFDSPPRTASPLYTSTALASEPWPDFVAGVATSTRFWAIDAVNRGRVLVSKLFEDYIAPEYNTTLSINLGDERDLTAIGKLDDKVIVFEPDDIHVIYGDGPDNRGQGQEFAVHYISTDVGCQDQKSVIETPAGLLFYSSPRGFYLLDRNLQIQFVGSAVEDLARGIRVKSAVMDPGNAEVRFLVEPDPDATQTERYGPDADTTAITRPPRPVFGNALPEDACLVFYYETGDWMLYTNYPGEAACIYQRRYTRILDDWSIWQESDEYSDPTGENRILLRSPPIRLSETIQDYNRLWRITILGRYLSALRDLGGQTYEAGDIVVRLYFDYEATPSQEKRFRMQDFGFNPWNVDPKRAERLQFEIHPKRGRAQAVKIEIEEVNSEDLGEGLTYGLGAGFEIVSADLFVGVGPSRSLLPQAVKA